MYKIFAELRFRDKTRLLPKILLRMKFTFFFMTVFLLQSKASIFAQKISLSVKNATLTEVVGLIRQQTNINIFYNNESVVNLKPITISVKNKELTAVLDECFKGQPLTYQLINNTILITAKAEQAKTTPPVPPSITVSGQVTGEKGEPLAGVTVKEKTSATAVASDKDGNYKITVQQDAVLVFTFIGYETREIPVNGLTNVNAALQMANNGLNQVVVVGYGTQKKVTVTGSVVSLNGSDIVKTPETNVALSLEGKLPGLNINVRSGESGNEDVEVLIRGKGTLGNNSPLVVIDGVASADDFTRINPNDIESVTVLKDASAAIYGVQAANGVILVTTKRAKEGKPTLTYSGSFLLTQPDKIPNLMSSSQYAIAENEYLEGVGQPDRWTAQDITLFENGTDPIQHPNVNWWKETFRTWTPQNVNNLSVSGGTQSLRYYVSGQQTNEGSNYRNNDGTGYTQKQFRANLDGEINSSLSFSIDYDIRSQDKDYGLIGGFGQIISVAPNVPAMYPNGLLGPVPFGYNPLIMGSQIPGYNNTVLDHNNLRADVKLKLDEITNGLFLEGFVANSADNSTNKIFQRVWYVYSYDPATKQYDPIRGGQTSTNPYLLENLENDNSLTYNIKLAYQHDFGKNKIDAFAAYEQNQSNSSLLGADRYNFISDQLDQLNFGSSVGETNSGSATESARQNYFGRINYSYDNKYLLNATLRVDGSQNFAPQNRFGTFPSISAGWRISQEPFFKDITFINDLKIRASWGKLGNDAIPAFQYLATYKYGTGYFFGANATNQYAGLQLATTPNPNITWEVANDRNIGLDAILLNNKLSISADYFNNVRSNILIVPTASIPTFTGLTLPDENLGVVSNKGFEIEANYQNKVNPDWSYSIDGNISYSKNRVDNIDEPNNIPSYQRLTGHPIDAFMGYKADGIYQTQDQINATPHLPGAVPGDIRYVDVNGDGKIDALDEIRSDYSETPRVIYGLTLGGQHKNLDLSIFLQGQADVQAYVMPTGLYEDESYFTGRWQQAGDNTYPRAFVSPTGPVGNNALPSTFWIKSAAFIRLKNVQLGYTLSDKATHFLKISKARFYVSGENLLVLDGIKILDPENASSNGVIYPIQRVLALGLNVTF
jgi:TonB-linked SusC/RagA family outer membrane protein